MAEHEPNPYQAGTEVSFATSDTAAHKGHGLIWFFIAVGVMMALSMLGRNVRILRRDEFFLLSGMVSFCCSGIGLRRAFLGFEKISSRTPLSSLLNFISFFLNTLWCLLIVYVLSFFLYAWITSS